MAGPPSRAPASLSFILPPPFLYFFCFVPVHREAKEARIKKERRERPSLDWGKDAAAEAAKGPPRRMSVRGRTKEREMARDGQGKGPSTRETMSPQRGLDLRGIDVRLTFLVFKKRKQKRQRRLRPDGKGKNLASSRGSANL